MEKTQLHSLSLYRAWRGGTGKRHIHIGREQAAAGFQKEQDIVKAREEVLGEELSIRLSPSDVK